MWCGVWVEGVCVILVLGECVGGVVLLFLGCVCGGGVWWFGDGDCRMECVLYECCW